jgi:hypothetical protein
MKCPKCNGDKIIITKDTYIQGGIYDCDMCHGTGRVKDMTKSCFNCANKEEIYDNGEENIVVCEINRYRENIYLGEAKAVAERCIAYKEEPMTNEEWFNGLSTETKARIMHLVYMAGYSDGFKGAETIPLRDIMEWLKQPYEQKGD